MQKRLILSGVAECKEESLRFSWGLRAVWSAFCLGENIAKVCLLGREENKVISKTQWQPQRQQASQGCTMSRHMALEGTQMYLSRESSLFPLLSSRSHQHIHVGTYAVTPIFSSPFLYVCVNSHAIVEKIDILIRMKSSRKIGIFLMLLCQICYRQVSQKILNRWLVYKTYEKMCQHSSDHKDAT